MTATPSLISSLSWEILSQEKSRMQSKGLTRSINLRSLMKHWFLVSAKFFKEISDGGWWKRFLPGIKFFNLHTVRSTCTRFSKYEPLMLPKVRMRCKKCMATPCNKCRKPQLKKPCNRRACRSPVKAYLHGQWFSVLDATAASDTAQKIGIILFFVRCRMRLSHPPTLKIMVRVNRPLLPSVHVLPEAPEGNS
jgi:hypothetical protein